MSNTPTLKDTLTLLTKGGPHHPKLVEAIYEVFGLVDSLQQQLESSVTRIGELKRQARRSDSELDGAIKEVVNLREQLAERDRTIAL
ncbi:hypothetical protein, partial [Paenibacillus maysiensis]|uniref:hypothetical protein n=1 Tax=Paenibacillus maysiensis TaxID=1155954 RepID=UPI0012DE51B6